MFKAKPAAFAVLTALGFMTQPAVADSSELVAQDGTVLVGYWHNWCDGRGYQGGNAPCLPLSDVASDYNVVNVSFMKVYDVSEGRIPTFKLDPNIGLSDAEFISQISALNAQGRSVLLALGGADAHIELKAGDEVAFADEIIRLVDTYGFDGVDIDLEQAAVDASDNQTVIPAALRMVKDHYQQAGQHFVITMAPEFPYLTASGKYTPYLKGLEGYYDYINPQFYNQGGDGVWVDGIGWLAQSNDAVKEDFIFYMADSLANGTRGFTQIPAEKLVFGIPSNIDAAATGFIQNPADLYRAFDRMKAQGQPLKGVMTWSVNWDVGTNASGQQYNGQFAKNYGPFVHSQTVPVPDGKPVLSGVEDIRVPVGGQFDAMAGVSATDAEDGSLTQVVVVQGTVNTAITGAYSLTYTVTDSDGNQTSAARLVTVYNSAPVLSGVSDVIVLQGEAFDPLAGVSASDEEDGDLTASVTVSGQVDVNTIGSYVLTYSVSDADGLNAEAERTVTVTDDSQICSDAWQATAVYNAGDVVSYDGKTWKAKWWTQNNVPGAEQWGPWEETGSSGCAGTVVDPVEPVDPETPTDPTEPTDPVEPGAYSAYQAGENYGAGDRVSNLGSDFECKPYPYSAWCAGAAWAYEPGVGSAWQDAWIKL
ncbi:immunoglobulin-like domain-containing protein [Photobacterium salinisoli]|uniref:immunoglobulin-like domain-containing protein n=1 Tax=Photobacterium salinisoli TaxID=1616783 RepID=UPI003B835DB8